MKMTCDCCGEYFYDEDLYTLDDGSQVCEECYNNEAHTCCNCGATFLDEPEYDENYNEYCEDCAHDCDIKPPFDYMSAAHAMMEERMIEEYEKNW